MKHLLSLLVLALGISSCNKLSEGVVRDIAFPEHDPQIAVTFMARPIADTLVARAHSSAGILDSIGSKRIKEAVFTLEDASGTSITWGGEADWVQGLGHVLTDVELADGNWTLTVEAPEFETVTAAQVMPPRIDSTGSYAYTYTAALEDEFVYVDEFGYTHLTRTIDFSLTLPTVWMMRITSSSVLKKPSTGKISKKRKKRNSTATSCSIPAWRTIHASCGTNSAADSSSKTSMR